MSLSGPSGANGDLYAALSADPPLNSSEGISGWTPQPSSSFSFDIFSVTQTESCLSEEMVMDHENEHYNNYVLFESLGPIKKLSKDTPSSGRVGEVGINDPLLSAAQDGRYSLSPANTMSMTLAAQPGMYEEGESLSTSFEQESSELEKHLTNKAPMGDILAPSLMSEKKAAAKAKKAEKLRQKKRGRSQQATPKQSVSVKRRKAASPGPNFPSTSQKDELVAAKSNTPQEEKVAPIVIRRVKNSYISTASTSKATTAVTTVTSPASGTTVTATSEQRTSPSAKQQQPLPFANQLQAPKLRQSSELFKHLESNSKVIASRRATASQVSMMRKVQQGVNGARLNGALVRNGRSNSEDLTATTGVRQPGKGFGRIEPRNRRCAILIEPQLRPKNLKGPGTPGRGGGYGTGRGRGARSKTLKSSSTTKLTPPLKSQRPNPYVRPMFLEDGQVVNIMPGFHHEQLDHDYCWVYDRPKDVKSCDKDDADDAGKASISPTAVSAATSQPNAFSDTAMQQHKKKITPQEYIDMKWRKPAAKAQQVLQVQSAPVTPAGSPLIKRGFPTKNYMVSSNSPEETQAAVASLLASQKSDDVKFPDLPTLGRSKGPKINVALDSLGQHMQGVAMLKKRFASVSPKLNASPTQKINDIKVLCSPNQGVNQFINLKTANGAHHTVRVKVDETNTAVESIQKYLSEPQKYIRSSPLVSKTSIKPLFPQQNMAKGPLPRIMHSDAQYAQSTNKMVMVSTNSIQRPTASGYITPTGRPTMLHTPSKHPIQSVNLTPAKHPTLPVRITQTKPPIQSVKLTQAKHSSSPMQNPCFFINKPSEKRPGLFNGQKIIHFNGTPPTCLINSAKMINSPTLINSAKMINSPTLINGGKFITLPKSSNLCGVAGGPPLKVVNPSDVGDRKISRIPTIASNIVAGRKNQPNLIHVDLSKVMKKPAVAAKKTPPTTTTVAPAPVSSSVGHSPGSSMDESSLEASPHAEWDEGMKSVFKNHSPHSYSDQVDMGSFSAHVAKEEIINIDLTPAIADTRIEQAKEIVAASKHRSAQMLRHKQQNMTFASSSKQQPSPAHQRIATSHVRYRRGPAASASVGADAIASRLSKLDPAELSRSNDERFKQAHLGNSDYSSAHTSQSTSPAESVVHNRRASPTYSPYRSPSASPSATGNQMRIARSRRSASVLSNQSLTRNTTSRYGSRRTSFEDSQYFDDDNDRFGHKRRFNDDDDFKSKRPRIDTEEKKAETNAITERRIMFVGFPKSVDITQEVLRSRFEKFGVISNIKIYNRRAGHENSDYAFVYFEQKEACNEAIAHGNKGEKIQLSLSFGGRRSFCQREWHDMDVPKFEDEMLETRHDEKTLESMVNNFIIPKRTR